MDVDIDLWTVEQTYQTKSLNPSNCNPQLTKLTKLNQAINNKIWKQTRISNNEHIPWIFEPWQKRICLWVTVLKRVSLICICVYVFVDAENGYRLWMWTKLHSCHLWMWKTDRISRNYNRSVKNWHIQLIEGTQTASPFPVWSLDHHLHNLFKSQVRQGTSSQENTRAINI